jgi:integrase
LLTLFEKRYKYDTTTARLQVQRTEGFPKNWLSKRASTKKPWYIYYRFYDSRYMDKFPKGKLRVIKGMNEFDWLEDRQEAVRMLIETELKQLKDRGYNPIAHIHALPIVTETAILPETPFMEAMYKAFENGNYIGSTKSDIKGVLNYIGQAARILQYDYLPIGDFRTLHLLPLMEQCGRMKQKWTNNTYNVYLKYLSMLFSYILQYGAMEYNPARNLKKKKTTKSIRKLLSSEECNRIDEFVKSFDIYLWRFINIFFHSGSRTTEILRVQGEHVDLKNQRVKYLVLKGSQHEWVYRPIKNIALPLWQDAINGCGPKDFVFSAGLRFGVASIRADQVCRRWRTHVKRKLGINCDFYSLKHLNTDQTSAILGLNAAAAHNSHKSLRTTQAYAVNESNRVHDQIKKLNNGFAQNVNHKD